MATLTEEQIRAIDTTVDACTRTAATAEQIFEELARNGGQGGDVAAAIARHNSDAAAHARMRSYQGATATAAGVPGLVPAAQPDDRTKALMGDGSWGGVAALGDLLPRPLGKVALAGESALAARADHVHPATDIFDTGYATGGAGFRKISHNTALAASDPRKLSLRATTAGLSVSLPPVEELEADGNAFVIHAEGLNGVTVTTAKGAALGQDQGLVKAGSMRLFLLVDKASETWIAADFAASAQNADPSQGGGSFRNPTLGTATTLISGSDGHDVSYPNVITMTPIDGTRLFALWCRRMTAKAGNVTVYSHRFEAAVIAVRDGALEVKSPCILAESTFGSTDGYLYGRPFAHVIDATRVLVTWSINSYPTSRGLPETCQYLNMATLLQVEGNSLTETRTLGLSALNKQGSYYMSIYPLGGDSYIILDRYYKKFVTITINADGATQSVAQPYTFSTNYNAPIARLSETDFLMFYQRNPANQANFLTAMFFSYEKEVLTSSSEIALPLNNIGNFLACEQVADGIFAAIIRDYTTPNGLRAVPLRVDQKAKTVTASSSALAVAATMYGSYAFCNKVRDGVFLVCYPTSVSGGYAFTATLVEYNDAFVFIPLSSKTLTGLKAFNFKGYGYGDDQYRMVRLSERVYALPIQGTAMNIYQGGALFVYLNEETTEVESVTQVPFTPLQGTSGQEGNMDYPYLACAGGTVAVSHRANYLSNLTYCVAPITFS